MRREEVCMEKGDKESGTKERKKGNVQRKKIKLNELAYSFGCTK